MTSVLSAKEEKDADALKRKRIARLVLVLGITMFVIAAAMVMVMLMLSSNIQDTSATTFQSSRTGQSVSTQGKRFQHSIFRRALHAFSPDRELKFRIDLYEMK